MKKTLEVLKDEENEIPFHVMEESIVAIGNAMRKLAKTRVSKKLLVALIQDDTKLGKGTIELVLESYENLEVRYLRKK